LGSSRAFYAAASLGVLPRKLRTVNKKGTPVVALYVALLIYLCLMISIWKFEIEEKYLFLLTTQGFIVLYGGSVIAFVRKSKGVLNRVIALVAMIVWVFLMQGFGWMILYPLILMILGSFYHNQLVQSFRFIKD
jgi:APA family basic amino acid/polyamine antiporter/amino acid efflux transporter